MDVSLDDHYAIRPEPNGLNHLQLDSVVNACYVVGVKLHLCISCLNFVPHVFLCSSVCRISFLPLERDYIVSK